MDKPADLTNVLLVVFIVSFVFVGLLWFVGVDTTQWECSTRCVRLHIDCGLSNECPLVKECCVEQFGECSVLPLIPLVDAMLFRMFNKSAVYW
jgi:hypothetical protein